MRDQVGFAGGRYTKVRTSGFVTLNPTDQLPFPPGWGTTARVAWRLLRPVRLAAVAPYLVAYALFVLVENLAFLMRGSELPSLATWAYVGCAATVAFAVSTTVVFSHLVEGSASVRGSLAYVSSRTRPVLLASLLVGALFSVLSTWNSGIAIVLLFFLLGPPFVIHAVVLERATLGDALRLTRLRLRKRALDGVSATCVLGFVVAAVRIRARGTASGLVEGVSSYDRFPGFLLDGVLWGLISAVTLTYMGALWLVAYLNARSLSEGTDMQELAGQWRFLSKGRP